MAWSLLTSQAKKRSQILAIDLGTRATKAVHLQHREGGFELLQFSILDAPVFDKGISPEALGEHLKAVVQAAGAGTKFVALAMGVQDSILRPAEMPLVPVSDMRQLLKYNSKAYFQQDFPDHSFDCHILPPQAGKNPAEPFKSNQKCRVLVGAARKQLLETVQAGAKNAGLVAEFVTTGIAGTLNAFALAEPEVFSKQVVALVDLGFRTSVINLIMDGELTLSRVVNVGSDRLTSGIAESMNISYAEAEGIKVGMPEEVQSTMLPLLTPLGRELRASIDFFEHQYDRTIGRVFMSGGAARSPFLIESLQTEMMVPCEKWNPLAPLRLSLPPVRVAEAESVFPQLAVAVGAALAALS